MDKDADEAIKFKLEPKPSSKSETPSDGKPSDQQPEDRKTQTRSKLHQQSLDNLSGLNSRIVEQNQLFGGQQGGNNGEPSDQNRPQIGRPLGSGSFEALRGGFAGGGFGGGGQGGFGQQGQQGSTPFGRGRFGDAHQGGMYNGSSPGNGQQGQQGGGGANQSRPGNFTGAVPGRQPAGEAPNSGIVDDSEMWKMLNDVDTTVAQFDGFNGNAGFVDERGRASLSHWSQVGGLSLAVDIPKDGRVLKFTKVSGEPKLALTLRSRELLDTGLGVIWTAVWIGIGAVLLFTFGRVGSRSSSTSAAVGVVLFGAGLASYLVLPNPLATLGFVAFVVGAITIAVRYARFRVAR